MIMELGKRSSAFILYKHRGTYKYNITSDSEEWVSASVSPQINGGGGHWPVAPRFFFSLDFDFSEDPLSPFSDISE